MYDMIRPLLFRLDPESIHNITSLAARIIQTVFPQGVESLYGYGHGALGQQLFGITFSNPVGLAAGFDKNARLIRFLEALGCGFLEVGSVTAHPSSGNPRPRSFRLPADRALINRMGLNNHGAERIASRLRRLRHKPHIPVGINIAKTPHEKLVGKAAINDYCQSFILMAQLADYVTINISCPNTSTGKTFEDAERLDALLHALFTTRRALDITVPVLVKLPPSISPKIVFDSLIHEIITVSLEHGVSGFIASNTSQDRTGLTTSSKILGRIGAGGLSGHPLLERTLQLVRYVYRQTEGKVPIIGVGGIDSSEAAFRMLRAGASLIQIYTGLIYEGPRLIRNIKEDLVNLVEKEGYKTVGALIGADHH